MRALWRAFVAALGGGLVTFVISALLGLNSWVSDRLHRSWFLPGYETLFPVLLVVSVFGLLLWSRRANWSPLTTLILGMITGEVAGVVSYLLHPFIGRGYTLSHYLETFLSPERIAAVGVVSVVIPVVLFAWLYGGLMTGLALLGYHWLSPHRSPT